MTAARAAENHAPLAAVEMPNDSLSDSASTIGPDAPGSLDPRFRVEGELAVRAILRELMTRHALVAVYPEGRAEDALVTTIAYVDADGVELDASGVSPAAALRSAHFAVGVAFPDNVKTQFELRGLSVTEEVPRARSARGANAPVSRHASDAAATTLHARLPAVIYRLQRRDAFRVHPPLEDAARCVRRLGDGNEIAYALFDLSAGGLSVVVPAGESPPSRDELWRHSRIETGSGRTIPCDLLVRRVFEDPSGTGAHRVAFAFHAPPSEVLRQIQLYVIDLEKRAMTARLRPACS